MANPQTENGYAKIANELLDALSWVNLPAYEWRVLMCILRKTYGWNKKSDFISVSQISKGTGLSRSHACRAKRSLLEKKLLIEHNGLLGPNKDYDTWNVTNPGTVPKSVMSVTNLGNKSTLRGQKQRNVTDSGNVTNSGNSVTNPGNKTLPVQALQKKGKTLLQKKGESSELPKSKTQVPTTSKTEQSKAKSAKQKTSRKREAFKPPTAKEVRAYADTIDYCTLSAEGFVDWYASKGWMVGKNKMKDWQAAVRTWKQRDKAAGKKTGGPQRNDPNWLPTENEVDELFRQTGMKP